MKLEQISKLEPFCRAAIATETMERQAALRLGQRHRGAQSRRRLSGQSGSGRS